MNYACWRNWVKLDVGHASVIYFVSLFLLEIFMKSIYPAVAALALSLSSLGVLAADSMTTKVAAETKSTAEKAPMADGEVKKIDKERGKVTIKHGEIKNLDMPGMTMVFGIQDPAMLQRIKAGDKIKFSAENIKGKLTVTTLEIAK